MLRQCLYIGLTIFCLLADNQDIHASVTAADGGLAVSSVTPGTTVSSTTTPLSPTPTSISASPTSTPVNPSASTMAVNGPDAGQSRKFYTISVALREIYDNNIFTSQTNKTASMETDISPSILFDFPMENTDFSARETFSATYYSNRPGGQFDFTNSVVAQLQHSFSDRFSFNMSEQFSYYTEPSLFQNVGTLYYDGAYIANSFAGSFNAQWTPLVSSVLSYSNTYVDYMAQSTATGQNSLENIGSGTIGFAILPKITLTFGGIADDITYNQYDRGYTSLTADTGFNWQALPSLSTTVAVGGSSTTTNLSTSTVTPYAAVTLNWQLGAKSYLNFNYSHSIVPSDVVQSQGQVADRFGSTFRYDILPSLSAHLEGTLTHGVYTNELIAPNTISGFSENDFAIDVGLTYHINSHFDVNIGNIYSGVSSGLSFRDYNRDQVYLGVRGTY
jgi:hypothetical protein